MAPNILASVSGSLLAMLRIIKINPAMHEAIKPREMIVQMGNFIFFTLLKVMSMYGIKHWELIKLKKVI
jgi:hypothetical protein